MANENNKAHELASESDEDTSELEILPATFAQAAEPDEESESDAATHSFEKLERTRRNETLAAFEAELRERDALVGRLEFEVEQLRSRIKGHEAELAAREAATANLVNELTAARQALAAAREHVERRDAKIADLEAELAARDARLADTTGALTAAQAAAEQAQAAKAELEPRLLAADERIAALTFELEMVRGEARHARESAEAQERLRKELEQQHAEARSMIETLKQYIEGRKVQWEQQEVLLRTKDTLLDEQQRKLGELAKESAEQRERLRAAEAEAAELRARQAALAEENAQLGREVASLRRLSRERARERDDHHSLEARYSELEAHAEQARSELESLRAGAQDTRELARERDRLAGALAAEKGETSALRAQVARTERYADGLRRQLRDRSAEAEAAEAARRELADAVAAADARIEALSRELAAERERVAELERLRAEDQRRFEEELKQLRLDLTSAQQTIAENQTVNEQLASDLLETSSFRAALESQLSLSDESHRKQVRELTRELKKLRQQLEETQRKVASKDAAIGVLLAELASKPGAPAGEAEPVVQRLEERKPPAAEERAAPERDKERTARLLVGTLDGQEVRFPLFKNKLTIGRTAHNDIQLRAQYISRRHAVVVCDHDSTRIVDWGSKNGIYVNGVRVSEKILKHGDKVTVGTAEFRYEELPKR